MKRTMADAIADSPDFPMLSSPKDTPIIKNQETAAAVLCKKLPESPSSHSDDVNSSSSKSDIVS